MSEELMFSKETIKALAKEYAKEWSSYNSIEDFENELGTNPFFEEKFENAEDEGLPIEEIESEVHEAAIAIEKINGKLDRKIMR